MVALMAGGLAGCRAAAKAPVHDTFTKLGGDNASSVPELSYGSRALVKTRGGYGWVRFTADAGDQIEVWARSQKGDAVAFVLDDNDDVLAANDDAEEGASDAHLTVSLPTSGSYWIAVRDYDYAPIQAAVELEGSGVFSCQKDSDCLAVPAATCCDNGWHTAVNREEVERYWTLFACDEERPSCPRVQVQDARDAGCNLTTHKCEMRS